MKIALIGGSGFIGSTIARVALAQGHTPVVFSRQPSTPGARLFRPGVPPDFSGFDAVINLAGHTILCPWTKTNRERIVKSRVDTTRLVVTALATSAPSATLVNASAIGFYGDAGESICTEDSPAGEGFLAEVCQAWEHEARQAEAFGVRVVRIRVGFVLGNGGAMRLLKPVFKLCLGGNLGSGKQWMSCIRVEDLAMLFLTAAADTRYAGAVNGVMPEPVRNADFTRAVAKAAKRPVSLPAPAPVLRLGLGELSRVMLDSQRVVPARALQCGFRYEFATLPAALSRLF